MAHAAGRIDSRGLFLVVVAAVCQCLHPACVFRMSTEEEKLAEEQREGIQKSLGKFFDVTCYFPDMDDSRHAFLCDCFSFG